jgi:hypothetical protein
MPETTPELGPKPHVSLFTRLAAVEAELEGLRSLIAVLKTDHDAMRKDRDEWRWRAERLLADQELGFWGWINRVETASGRLMFRFWTLVRTPLATVLQTVRRRQFWFARLKVHESEDDAAVALPGAAHSPHAVHDGGLDLDEALAALALHRPSR